MSVNIEMPKLSDTMTEGTLVKWHKQVGDTVEIGDVLAEIETDKATMEMEAFDEGVLTEILVQAGETTPIGTLLAVLNGDTNRTAVTAISTTAPPPAQADLSPTSATVASSSVSQSPGPLERHLASPLARKIAADLGVNLASVAGTGPGGRIIKNDVETAAALTKPAPVSAPSTEAIAAAALAASIKTKNFSAAATTTTPVTNPQAPQVLPVVMGAEDERVELSTMRRIIASRLLLAKTTIPHFYLHLEVDAAPLISLRRQINEQAEHTHGNKYSINDFILKAVILAVQALPDVNASFAGDHIIKFKHIGLSIAIAVDDGLVTPVIKQAETQSLLALSRTVKDFALRARDKKLKPDEFDGGTITVSNLGAWGIESFDAIINPPQASILAVGAAIEKPVVKNGRVVPGLRINLGLSCDHRVIDGVLGTQFLMEVRKLVEKPALMLL